MDAIQLLLISLIGYCAAALFALFFGASGAASRRITGALGFLASLVGVLSALRGVTGAQSLKLTLFQAPPFGAFVLQMDMLSAFMVGLIGLIGIATSVYAISSPQNNRWIEFFTNIFIAAMLLVVTISNAFYFLLFWEVMTLASYFLVIWETRKLVSVRDGYVYMLVAHLSAALIMLAFFLLFQRTGSFEFEAFKQTVIPASLANLLFLLTFLGFGAKAGMVPLHFWTPGTYSAAPNHVSALMAGVMKKTALYGILRLSVDLLGVHDWWWGFLLLLFGAISALIGAFYALSERDLKRLLAYSSVENLGIIMMGAGLGLVGLAIQQPLLTVMGFIAALFHALNHAFFKSLLFLGAGCVLDQVIDHNLNRMGGLARRMPWTALLVLIGVLAVTAIPPLNGFVSEWFTYQSLFSGAMTHHFPLKMFGPLIGVILALAGAIAVMVYIKAYGSVFAGPPRSEAAAKAHESGFTTLASLIYLAFGCLALGIGAPLIVPWIAQITTSFTSAPAVQVSNGWQIFPGNVSQAVLSPPLIGILLVGLLTVPWLIALIFGRTRLSSRQNVEPWSCGYGYSSRMSLTASGFDQPVKTTFRGLYQLRTLLAGPAQMVESAAKPALSWITRVEPLVENVVTKPTNRLIETAGQWIQALQMGDIRVYCLYIIITLAVLLVLLFGRGGL